MPYEEKLLARMTLSEKIGQMFLVCVTGLSMNNDLESMLRQYHFGGVYLYDRNYINPFQFGSFCADLSAVIRRSCKSVPAILSTCYEGGSHTRFGLYNSSVPYACALGCVSDADLVRQAGLVLGSQLSGFGLNLNLAPFLNLSRSESPYRMRAFGNEPGTVSRCGKEIIEGMRSAGVGCAVKHFPGLGAFACMQEEDCLIGCAGQRMCLEEHLSPFAEVLSSGADAVILSHLLMPKRPNGHPSAHQNPYHFLCETIRDDLHFNGVILTDELQTFSQCGLPSPERMAQYALRADVDILLFGRESKKQLLIHETMFEEVSRGMIPQSRIDRSVRRILQLKQNLKRYFDRRQAVDPQQTARIMSRLASETVRIVTRGQALPLPFEKDLRVLVVQPRNSNLTNIGYTRTMNCCLADVISTRVSRMKVVYFEDENSPCFLGGMALDGPLDLVLLAAEAPSPDSALIHWINRSSIAQPAIYLAISELDTVDTLSDRVAVISVCSNSNDSMIRAVDLILPPEIP